MDNWSNLQKNAIMKWVHFKTNSDSSFQELSAITIVKLLESLSNTKCSHPLPKNIKNRFGQIDVSNILLQYASSLGIRTNSIAALDIVDHNDNLILSLLISIATKFMELGKYQLKRVMDWIVDLTQLYITNFKSDWSDGFLLKFICCSDDPFNVLNKLEIPCILDAKDIGKDEFTTTLFIVIVYEHKQTLQDYRDSLINLNEKMHSLYSQRNSYLSSIGRFTRDDWKDIDVVVPHDNIPKIQSDVSSHSTYSLHQSEFTDNSVYSGHISSSSDDSTHSSDIKINDVKENDVNENDVKMSDVIENDIKINDVNEKGSEVLKDVNIKGSEDVGEKENIDRINDDSNNLITKQQEVFNDNEEEISDIKEIIKSKDESISSSGGVSTQLSGHSSSSSLTILTQKKESESYSTTSVDSRISYEVVLNSDTNDMSHPNTQYSEQQIKDNNDKNDHPKSTNLREEETKTPTLHNLLKTLREEEELCDYNEEMEYKKLLEKHNSAIEMQQKKEEQVQQQKEVEIQQENEENEEKRKQMEFAKAQFLIQQNQINLHMENEFCESSNELKEDIYSESLINTEESKGDPPHFSERDDNSEGERKQGETYELITEMEKLVDDTTSNYTEIERLLYEENQKKIIEEQQRIIEEQLIIEEEQRREYEKEKKFQEEEKQRKEEQEQEQEQERQRKEQERQRKEEQERIEKEFQLIEERRRSEYEIVQKQQEEQSIESQKMKQSQLEDEKRNWEVIGVKDNSSSSLLTTSSSSSLHSNHSNNEVVRTSGNSDRVNEIEKEIETDIAIRGYEGHLMRNGQSKDFDVQLLNGNVENQFVNNQFNSNDSYDYQLGNKDQNIESINTPSSSPEVASSHDHHGSLVNSHSEAVNELGRHFDEACIIDDFHVHIRQWIGTQCYTIKYDSSRDGLTPLAFNSRVCGMPNIMILIITTEGYSFGCYNRKVIPSEPTRRYKYIKNDQRFFVFSLRNPENNPPFRVCRKSKGKSFCVWCSENRAYTFTIKRFLRIVQAPQGSHFISGLYHKCYRDTTRNSYQRFTGNDEISIHKVVAIQWS
ncbi:E3 ubiquitin protein ligase BRE1 [Entamoeba marina]